MAVTTALALPAIGYAETCSNASLNNDYTIVVLGTYATVNHGALDQIVSGVGKLTADGAGKLSGAMTATIGNVVYRDLSLTGTYAIGSSCAGTTRLNFSGGGGLPFDIVVGIGSWIGVDSDENTSITITAQQP